LGNFAASAEDSVIPLAWVEAANERWRAEVEDKEIANEKNIPAVGAAIGIERIAMSESIKFPTPRIVKKPKVYFPKHDNNFNKETNNLL